MAVTPPPSIDTDMSDPPNRGQAQAVFSPKMDTYLANFEPLRVEINDLADWMETIANGVEAEANAAAASATAATGSAAAAAGSATAASGSATLAETNSLAYIGWYSARHQGSHISAPSVRNNSSALVAGDLYYNATDGNTYIWS